MIECYGADGKKADLSARPVWVDINGTTKEDAAKVQDAFGLHPLTTEDLVTPHVRIKIEDFPDYLLCVFYGLDEKARPHELDLIIGKDFCITNHKQKPKSVEHLTKDEERISTLLAKGPDFVFHRILDEEVDQWVHALQKLDGTIEKLDDSIMDNPTNQDYKGIRNLKKHVVELRRVSFTQREKLRELAKSDHRYLSKKAVPYFRDVTDHAIRIADSLDTLREGVASLGEAYMGAVSQKMNEVMKVLSIIATIALPLTVISGIYGTNFTNLPGQTVAFGFWLMLIGMGALTLGMILYFKKKGWY